MERSELLEKLSRGLEIGIELIKSIVRFVIDRTKELLTAKNLDEIKKFVAQTAETFGKSLSDVTHRLSDAMSDGFRSAKTIAEKGIDATGSLVSEAYISAKDSARKTAGGAMEAIKKAKRGNAQGVDSETEPRKALPQISEATSALTTVRKIRSRTRRK